MNRSFNTYWIFAGAIFMALVLLLGISMAAAPSGEKKTATSDTVDIMTLEETEAALEAEKARLEAETRRLEGNRGESVFTEIHVSPDGAYAVDSAGNEWEYDFTQDKFISEEVEDGGTKTIFGKKRPAPEPPVIDEKTMEEITKKMEKAKTMKGLKFGSVVIDTDERVRGPIIAMGEVTVRGKVIGDVFSYQKITVTSTGQITGNARAPEIVKMRGGIIMGERLEQDFFQMPPDIEDIFKGKSFAENSYVALIANTIIFFVLLLLGLLVIAIFPRPAERIKACLQKSFIKSFLVGLMIWIAFAPVMGLLILTIIGIPVALVAMPILLFLALILGFIGF
ncbi:MAG: polymer-forming cytoskeletal protein, partial [Candidatus Zixiibacteriota bacterium]